MEPPPEVVRASLLLRPDQIIMAGPGGKHGDEDTGESFE